VNTEFRKDDPHYKDRTLTPDALKQLRKHNWPGNLRELQNVITQAAVFSVSSDIKAADIDSAIASFKYSAEELVFSRTRGNDFRLPDRLAEIERVFIDDAMNESGGTQTAAAELLGISQQALSRKLGKLEV
jgi:two-component system response regulator HydG